MQRLEQPSFSANPWPDTKWTENDKPVLIVDGVLHHVKSLPASVSGHAGYGVGLKDRDLASLASHVDVEVLHLYEMGARDLVVLHGMARLRHLKIHWNTKLTDLSGISGLSRLETLALIDTPKVRDLSPLEPLAHLAALEYSGGIWSSQHAISLEPVARLPKLEELVLTNLKVESGGLRPLAHCKALKTLTLSNQFETEEYAYLSVALPDVECAAFRPWIRTSLPDGRDTMITGRRKPFLSSATDAARIAAYEEAFRKLQSRFEKELRGNIRAVEG
ncbi:MAG TPA: leucine-rich repeat domain-containing protein [Gemmatimonadaceae bacterium]|nr:leucine-rich repeat domain-containing protein [Gemmatimonadaceae bacterium]